MDPATTTRPFGAYIRRKRVEAGVSLRQLAEGLGVSHVYLSEVERGVRAAIAEDRWPKLIELIPSISMDALTKEKMLSKPLQMEISDAPIEYQNLALALARRIEKRDVEPDMMNRLLDMLGSNR